MGCCSCISNTIGGIFKYAIFIFNLLFVLAGVTLVTLGALIEVRIFDIADYTTINFHTSAIILMVGGSVAILVAFFGCCGAISNSRCLLNTYATILLVAFSLQLAGAIVVFAWNPEVAEELEVHMKELMTTYPFPQQEGEVGESSKKFWDFTQEYFECCGIRAQSSWSVYRPGLNGFPESCKCKDDYYWYNCDEQGFYKTGCFYRLKDAIFDLQEVMAWVAIGVGIFEFCIGVLTLIYANAKSGKDKKHQRV